MDDLDTITITGASVTDTLTGTGDTIILDLGSDISSLTSSSISTITLDDLTSTSYNWNNINSNVTIPTTGSGGTYTITGSGTGYNWGTTTSPTVIIGNDGMEIREKGDIKIGNVSLKEFMAKMEQRLAILVPDPERLEKFEALKKAYEHYKTMESLCFPEEKDKKE